MLRASCPYCGWGIVQVGPAPSAREAEDAVTEHILRHHPERAPRVEVPSSDDPAG